MCPSPRARVCPYPRVGRQRVPCLYSLMHVLDICSTITLPSLWPRIVCAYTCVCVRIRALRAAHLFVDLATLG